MAKPLLIAFDFDCTVVDENTDIVIRRLLKNEKLLASLKRIADTDGWTAYMEKVFQHLHANGVTANNIESAIKTIPAVAGFPALFKQLHSCNVDIIIISDSNSLFINHWLKHHGLDHTVNEIFTNPAWFNDKGLLNIKMYQLQDWCKLSEKNMCKGYILESYIEKRSKEGIKFDTIAYVGDGRNDLCPVLRLSRGDLAFPRLNYSLAKILSEADNNSENLPKADIMPWKDGTEIWQELTKRIPNLDKIDRKP